jgi:hypothetical protein
MKIKMKLKKNRFAILNNIYKLIIDKNLLYKMQSKIDKLLF